MSTVVRIGDSGHGGDRRNVSIILEKLKRWCAGKKNRPQGPGSMSGSGTPEPEGDASAWNDCRDDLVDECATDDKPGKQHRGQQDRADAGLTDGADVGRQAQGSHGH